MAHSEESDSPLESGPAQLDMFGAPPVPAAALDPAGVRAELGEILAQAGARELAWEAREASHYGAVLDEMASALSEEECAQLRLEFADDQPRKDAA